MAAQKQNKMQVGEKNKRCKSCLVKKRKGVIKVTLTIRRLKKSRR